MKARRVLHGVGVLRATQTIIDLIVAVGGRELVQKRCRPLLRPSGAAKESSETKRHVMAAPNGVERQKLGGDGEVEDGFLQRLP